MRFTTYLKNGSPRLGVELLLRTEFPSWGYMVAKGATTIWERWNGDTGDLAMNSYNHYALGAVTGFLYRRIAGIAADVPGFARILARPLLDARLGAGAATLETDHGGIASQWWFEADGSASYRLQVPQACQARVVLPGRDVQVMGAGTHDFEGLRPAGV